MTCVWYFALGCAAIIFFIISQYLITLVALVWRTCKLRANGRRSIARLRNLKPGEPLDAQPAVRTEPPLPGDAAFQPMLGREEQPEPEAAMSTEVPRQADPEVEPILEQQEAAELQPAVSRNRFATQKDDERARADNDEAITLKAKFGVTHEKRSVTTSKMGDKAGADADLANAKAIQARNSGKQVNFCRLADGSAKNEAALTPKEESALEVNSAAKKVRATKGSLGLSINQVTKGTAESLNVKPARGALVVNVVQNGPAEAAGVEPGDVIVMVDGKDVEKWREVQLIVANTPPGKDIALANICEGKELNKTVIIGELDDSGKLASFTSKLESVPQEYSAAVESKSRAAANQLAPGMASVEMRQQPVSNASLAPLTPTPPQFGKRRIDQFSKVKP